MQVKRALPVLATLLLAAASALARPHLSLVSLAWAQRPLKPGSIGVVRLAVASFGSETLLNSEARIQCFGCCDLVGSGSVLLGSLSPGAPKSIDVAANFTGDCPCVLSVLVNYEASVRQTAAGYLVDRSPGSTSLEVTVEPAFEPILDVAASPSSLSLGTTNNVVLTIVNRGVAGMKSVVVTVTASGGAIAGPAPLSVELGPLGVGESRRVELQVIPISNPVTLTIGLRLTDERGLLSERALAYALTASPGAVLVYLEPQAVPTASESRARVVVRNMGGDVARNVTLYLWAQAGSSVIFEPAIVSFGDVQPMSEASQTVTIKVPYGERGARAIPYALVYTGSDGNPRVVRDALSLVAVERARLEVASIEVAPSEPVVGSFVTVTVTLMNLGSAPIYGANVSLTLPQGLSAMRSSSHFLGQLNPYTPTAVPFSLRVERAGHHTVEITVTYRGYYGELESLSRSATVVAKQTPAGPGNRDGSAGWVDWGVVAAVAAVALVGSAVGALRRRKREIS